MIGSAEVDKQIRRIVSPILRDAGFTVVRTRNNWAHHDKCIWVVNIRAVGWYFGFCTGFPPMSLVASLSAYYPFVPEQGSVKVDKVGRLLPPEWMGHERLALRNHDFSLQIRSESQRRPEAKRDDIWWIEPDGSNVETMVNDLADSLKAEGLPWLEEMTDLETALRHTEEDRDCYVKFRLAMYLAREIGREETYMRYRRLFEEEARRIGSPAE